MNEPGQRAAGTARDVLARPDFRRVYLASFTSNAGRWMQNAALGVLAWEITGSSAYLGSIVFAQLGPLGLLSIIGGSLADTVDRRRLLIATQAWQMAWGAVLTALLLDGDIDPNLLLGLVFVIGLGQGVYAPIFTSVVPSLAGPSNLPAAISLNSAQLNAARVVGPAIGGAMTARLGFSEVFALNTVTYLPVLWALWVTPLPSPTSRSVGLSDRFLGGIRIAARAPQVGRPLLTMTAFSFLCLPFVGQLPAIAETRLGMEAQSAEYGWFYAAFGGGALIGAVMVGTVLLRFERPKLVRSTLLGFAAALAWLTSLASAELSYLAIFAVGLFYFVLPTTLNTLWQEHVDDAVRGRVAAIWILSFGGTVPVANIVAGQLVEATSLGAVLFGGSLAAIAIALLVRLPGGPVVGEAELAR